MLVSSLLDVLEVKTLLAGVFTPWCVFCKESEVTWVKTPEFYLLRNLEVNLQAHLYVLKSLNSIEAKYGQH